jgi:hypothetical protein
MHAAKHAHQHGVKDGEKQWRSEGVEESAEIGGNREVIIAKNKNGRDIDHSDQQTRGARFRSTLLMMFVLGR